MGIESGVLHNVSWRDCCPWLVLFRTIRLAIAVPILLSAAAGAVVNTAGWHVAGSLFLDEQDLRANAAIRDDARYLGRWPSERGGRPWPGHAATRVPDAWRIAGGPSEPILTVPYRFVRPLWQLFSLDLSAHAAAFYLFGALWTVAVWGLVGGLIARTAAMYLGREERIGWGEGWKHARRKWGAHLAAPALPLLGAVLIALPMVVLGWIMRLEWGLLLAGVLWVPVLLGALAMMVLLVGLLFGWPLMWGTIAAESSDAFDAISRSYAYTFQRPLQYLVYVLLAAVYGLLGWLLVWGASEAVVHLGYWGTGWGAGEVRTAEVQRHADIHGAAVGPGPSVPAPPLPDGPVSAAARIGLLLIGLGVALVRTLASAFAYSYFWCAMAAVYLLLRRDADETEMDDIFVDDQGETYGLPPLSNDEADVPGVPEPSPGPAAATTDDSGPPAT